LKDLAAGIFSGEMEPNRGHPIDHHWLPPDRRWRRPDVLPLSRLCCVLMTAHSYSPATGCHAAAAFICPGRPEMLSLTRCQQIISE
jgi:hypothetical protein